jgi:hypothetical protein
MEKHLVQFAAKFLKSYSEVLGNRGCNDQLWPDNWTMEQRESFLRGFHKFNESPDEDLQEDLKDLRNGRRFAPMDFACADYLAFLLGAE